MGKNVSLSEIDSGKTYKVTGFKQSSSAYADKLYKMGFVEGTPLQLAPVAIKDPIVIEIRGSRVALRKKEAQEVQVEEVKNA